MYGIVGFQADLTVKLLRSMTEAAAHRWPDGAGTVVITADGQPTSGLGHRRLAIIDLSVAGLQPLTMAGTCVQCSAWSEPALTVTIKVFGAVAHGVYSKFNGLPLDQPEDRHRWWFTFEVIIRYFIHFEAENACAMEF